MAPLFLGSLQTHTLPDYYTAGDKNCNNNQKGSSVAISGQNRDHSDALFFSEKKPSLQRSLMTSSRGTLKINPQTHKGAFGLCIPRARFSRCWHLKRIDASRLHQYPINTRPRPSTSWFIYALSTTWHTTHYGDLIWRVWAWTGINRPRQCSIFLQLYNPIGWTTAVCCKTTSPVQQEPSLSTILG